jgi:adenylate cyclase
MRACVDTIRECLEGAVPAIVATCDTDGTPNASYASQVHYVDGEHVALSYQFFNKTRQNILANPRATALVIDPFTVARYALSLAYVRTEASGPLFESMKAKLAGIASHTGMSGVFKLRGADIYRVLGIRKVTAARELAPPPRRNLLAAVRLAGQAMARCTELAALLDATLSALDTEFDIDHAMILMADVPGERLYTVASRGYPASGVGSEIPFGHGVIGVAARERTPVRINYMTTEYAYGRAIRESALASGLGDRLETEIPLPGLPASGSQLAVPVAAGGRLAGMLYVESPRDHRFGYDDEDALAAIATQLGLAMQHLQAAEAQDESPRTPERTVPANGTPIAVRHYARNDSVFLGDDYLIKGVAGAILWRLLRDYAREHRTEFTNRELRLDPAIRLPDIADNLEARLVLLQRRLLERSPHLRIEKTGRGRFRICVQRPVQLVDIPV